MLVSYAFAVAAAAVNATSNVLQRKANKAEPPQLSMRLGLILDLVRRPVWLAGFGAVLLSFILTAVALRNGQLAAVQPVLVLELPLTLLFASRTLGVRLHGREWGSALAMVVGLGGLLLALDPQAGTGGHAPALQWGLASAGTVGLAGTCVGFAVTGKGVRRSALLGIAGGVLFGLTAAYMKGMTGTLDHGIANVFTSWQLYAMAASGATALFLAQNALQAGRLLVAQPGITLCDPAIGMLWGILVFHESTRGGLALLAALVCGAVLVAGVIVLMHSPLLTDTMAEQQGQEQQGTEQQRQEQQGTEQQGTEPQGTEPQGTEPQGTEPQGSGEQVPHRQPADGREPGERAAAGRRGSRDQADGPGDGAGLDGRGPGESRVRT